MITFTVNADMYAMDKAAVKWILPIRGSTWYAGKRQQSAKPQKSYTITPKYIYKSTKLFFPKSSEIINIQKH